MNSSMKVDFQICISVPLTKNMLVQDNAKLRREKDRLTSQLN